MSWVVDTCILLDILNADPRFAFASADLLTRLGPEGLVICPITYVELAPAFSGRSDLQRQFLQRLSVDHAGPWTEADTDRAYEGWARQVQERRKGHVEKRPIADILIGAFASRFSGLLTRNPGDFRGAYPDLPCVIPGDAKT